MSEHFGENRMDAANARLARGDQFFWLLLTLMVIGSGVAQMLGLKLQKDDVPQLALVHSDGLSRRAWPIDHTPTASIKASRRSDARAGK